ncbi:LPS assembly lipoprotein LptE [Frigidibacter sp. RF13]|uniref:LPS assembly lipoprotein LptE n=1 Tax=Frigidibacter sp. RF13 TaxID=2997340 RepID=UPI0022717E12|nr:LPS assembly lipoprotein LptE [Frigidibacter sp. RF13]MCY1128375.1 LPS assembly lipoprotein LptE [Frigidibacter sp. RF13]
MSSSDRRTFLGLIAAAPLAACGFTPAYGPAGPAQGITGQIGIADPTDRNSFDLVGRLQERLGRSRSPRWQLGYAITTGSEGLGITSANTITRYNVTGSVSYRLTDLASGQTATQGTVKSFASYSASGTVISTAASERDAYERLMRILADQIVTDLIATSASWSGA